MVSEIDDLLFCDVEKYQIWAKENKITDIKDGEFLDFFRVVPTYSDRKAFYIAVLDTENSINPNGKSNITKCKKFYTKAVRDYDPYNLQLVLGMILKNLDYVYFEVYASGIHHQLYQGLVTRSEGLRHNFKATNPG